MCIYIYIYIYMASRAPAARSSPKASEGARYSSLAHVAVSTLFATTASTEALSGTIWGETVCSSPPCLAE